MGTMEPKSWWVNFGAQTSFLQTLAFRLLGQPSLSFCAERNWSTYAFIHSLKRNKLTTSRAQDLVYIHNNLQLLSKNPNDDVKIWDVGEDAFDSIEDDASSLTRRDCLRDLMACPYSDLAKVVLREQDKIFANRDPLIAGTIFSYGGHDIIWSCDVSDFFLVLSRYDLQGVGREMKRQSKIMDAIFEQIIKERIAIKPDEAVEKIGRKDFLQILLELKEQNTSTSLNITQIKSLLAASFVTTATPPCPAMNSCRKKRFGDASFIKDLFSSMSKVVTEKDAAQKKGVESSLPLPVTELERFSYGGRGWGAKFVVNFS
nr:hAT dimerization domain, ribonuclease H-like domain protein [Tanacetum cinerariifolium]